MKNKNFSYCLFLILIMILFTAKSAAEEGKSTPPEKPIIDRIKDHDYPSIARPWTQCIDFSNEERLKEISRHDIAWDNISTEKSSPGIRVIGANWQGKYRALGTVFSNLKETLERRKKLLSLNPNIIILAELRWRDYTDSSLPADHEFWKRDASGKRMPATGDKLAETRYYLDPDNPRLVDHLCKQAKYMVESGVFDGIFIDWFGPSADFFKKLREAIGTKYLIITNANYKYDPERAKYINGAFLECFKVELPEYLPQWEKTVQSPKINVLDMMGEPDGCTGKPDLKRMRNTTIYSLIHSNGYVVYDDHFHVHRWFSFWDIKLGKPKGEKISIARNAYKREFEKGIVVNNSSGIPVTVKFDRQMKRVSDNTTGTSFKIVNDDGDFFLFDH